MITYEQIERLAAMLEPKGVPLETGKFFAHYHLSNRKIWEAFEKFTNEARNRNKKLGAKAIMERVRWEVEIENGQDFKIQNSYIAYYVRLYELKYPHSAGYFEKREIKGIKQQGELFG